VKLIKLGDNTGPPAFFDISGRFWAVGRSDARYRPPWYGASLRVGDKAVLRGWLGEWRHDHPDRRIVVLTDLRRQTAWAQQVPDEWVLAGVADELRQVDDKVSELPVGQPLYDRHLFVLWKDVRSRPCLRAAAAVPAVVREHVRSRLDQLGVPQDFITVHPLHRAAYDHHRQAPLAWWTAVIRRLAEERPVVVLAEGADTALGGISGGNVFHLWTKGPSVLESVAAASLGRCHVGGTTGLTLWASIVQAPVVAAYRHWDRAWDKDAARGMDVRPGCFGAALTRVSLECPVDEAADAVRQIGSR
jgi:hypothetical protein